MITSDVSSKICTGCKIEKMLNCFHKDKTNELGVTSRCKDCRKTVRAKEDKTERYKKSVYDAFGEDFEVISDYKGSRVNIKLKHTRVGCEFEGNPSRFLRYGKCPICEVEKQRESKRKTHEEFEREVNERYKGEYSLVSRYTGASIKVDIRHNSEVCGEYIHSLRPNAFLAKEYKCPKCMGTLKKSHEEFTQRFYDKFGTDYEIISEFRGMNKEIKVRHISEYCDNFEWVTRGTNLMMSKGCAVCSGFKKVTKVFKEELYTLFKEKYILIGEFTNVHEKVKIKHNSEECGFYEFEVYPKKVYKRKIHCPVCERSMVSRGEYEIELFLKEKSLEYISQFSFKDCIDKIPLKFDFAIFKCGELHSLIEFDGIQHFEAIDFFGGESGLINRKRRDNIKDEYCKNKNINLIRIPYWEADGLEIVLEHELQGLIIEKRQIVQFKQDRI